jgi:hypothetical protein
MELFYITLTGFLVRADGWGPESNAQAASWPKWKLRASKFFNAWSCGALFAALSLATSGSFLVTLAAFFAFIVWRAPGFNGWQNFWAMFLRGAWTSLLGFAALSWAAAGHPFYGWLFIPFSIVYAAIYSGGYRYLPETIFGFNRHVWIENASGWAFGISVLIVQLLTV